LMPTTSILLRRKEQAAVEITALAAGAGPPANKMATLRSGDSLCGGLESGVVIVYCALLIVFNLLVDASYALLDRRIRVDA